MKHREVHHAGQRSWLRAAVLGANDGLISTSSLIVGVAAAQPSRQSVVVAGFAGLVAGALSMAAGEYVSVSSQADTERADLARERLELATEPDLERAELAGIYVSRGLTPDLARQVAAQLMERDALGAHARDELGINDATRARPIQAAVASAAAFTAGALPPVFLALILSSETLARAIFASSLVMLCLLGSVAAHQGGASMITGAGRVGFWGAVAMGTTALIGRWFGTVV